MIVYAVSAGHLESDTVVGEEFDFEIYAVLGNGSRDRIPVVIGFLKLFDE